MVYHYPSRLYMPESQEFQIHAAKIANSESMKLC